MATTGGLHEGPVPAGRGAGRGGFMAKRGHGHESISPGARALLLVIELITLAAFIITLGGLSSLQKTINKTQLDSATQLLYTDTFQSAGQVPYPMPGQGKNQFALQWWLLFFELVIFLTITALLFFPRYLLRFRLALMCFLTYVFVLITLQVQSLLYFKRNAAANLVFGHKAIKATLVGAMIAVVCNPLSIILLSLLGRHDDPLHHHTATTGTGKRVADVGEAPVATHV